MTITFWNIFFNTYIWKHPSSTSNPHVTPIWWCDHKCGNYMKCFLLKNVLLLLAVFSISGLNFRFRLSWFSLRFRLLFFIFFFHLLGSFHLNSFFSEFLAVIFLAFSSSASFIYSLITYSYSEMYLLSKMSKNIFWKFTWF